MILKTHHKNRILKRSVVGKSIVFIFVILLVCFSGIKFIQHERNQSKQIISIQTKLETLVEKNTAMMFDTSIFNDSGYNYLAIGNSITKHTINEYWWNEIGMAASTEKKDYVHLVSKGIKKNRESIKKKDGTTTDEVNVTSINFSIWEMQATDRAETFQLLNSYLSSKLDLVTIQLGENVSDTTTLERDFEELIRYIQKKCPQTKILMIGQFWTDEKKDNAKKQASISCEIEFIDLSLIQNDSTYQAGIGSIVYDTKGTEHIIEHEGVAKHPGDKGMKWISKQVLERLKK